MLDTIANALWFLTHLLLTATLEVGIIRIITILQIQNWGTKRLKNFPKMSWQREGAAHSTQQLACHLQSNPPSYIRLNLSLDTLNLMQTQNKMDSKSQRWATPGEWPSAASKDSKLLCRLFHCLRHIFSIASVKLIHPCSLNAASSMLPPWHPRVAVWMPPYHHCMWSHSPQSFPTQPFIMLYCDC